MDKTSIDRELLHSTRTTSLINTSDLTDINDASYDKDMKYSQNESSNQLSQSAVTSIFTSWQFIFNELIAQNRRLDEKIDQLEKTCHQNPNNQNERLNIAEKQMKDLHIENNQLKNQFDNHMKQCNTYSNNNQVSEEHDNQARLNKLEETNNHLNTCIVQLNIRLNNNEIQTSKFDKENKELKEKMKLLQEQSRQQLENSQEFIDLCLTQLNDQAKTIGELEKRMKKLDKQIVNDVYTSETKQILKTISCVADFVDNDPNHKLNNSTIINSQTVYDDREPSDVTIQINRNEISNDESFYMSNSMISDGQKQETVIPDKIERVLQTIQQYNDRSLMDLRRQELTDQDMKIVVQNIQINTQCERLWLDYNKITSIGLSILANGLNNNNNTLQQLSLSNNNISDDGIHSLVKSLSTHNHSLKELHLGHNKITDEGIKYLAEMLKTNQTLTHLYLQKNDITDNGIRILADVIEKYNSTIESLSLYSNKLLSDLSVHFLLQMIRNHRSLKKIYVYDCNLSQTGKNRLLSAQQSKQNFKVYVNSLND
ncbi:unnamed protein product [Adineta steineri]|uniref:Uncharacterized protein n=1 Tax=Adineta steineri TaxID=433720 RepID=A0A814FBV2_9BILA|nr:unnamed protein product [Adineta steineri]CAF0981156.1 unnamed protein product [Adineta steineri]